jgi:hypothetical protein
MTAQHEVKAVVSGTSMFAGLPRRRRAGAVVLLVWLGIAAAFLGDLVPTSSPGDWLYGVEARRDAHARALARREALPRTPSPAPPVVAAAPSVPTH